MYHGWVKNLDEVLYVHMRSPKSYTGEDVVEISCHGGVAIAKAILDRAIGAGARQAHPGEFTKRAFLNGRMDLVQAEAVLEAINAKTIRAAEAAAGHLGGRLSGEIITVRKALINALAEIEAGIDFPEDEDRGRVGRAGGLINRQLKIVESAIDGAGYGEMLKEGARVVIAGKPNVGKSSLLNRLLHEERALVTERPGTTRDTIEEPLGIKGIPVRLIDTAGIRRSRDKVELLGINRAKASIEKADLVIALYDASCDSLEREDHELRGLVKGRKVIVALNKSDLGVKLKFKGTHISAKTGRGIDKLLGLMARKLLRGMKTEGQTILSSRQLSCLVKAKQSLQSAEKSIRIKMGNELVAQDIKEAIQALGEMTGIEVSAEVIEKIFAEFCVGK
jgi:tRNA modification GTPase